MEDKGSRRHIRWYVNDAPDRLNASLFTASPSLASSASGGPHWVSPLAAEDYQEYWNEPFLVRLGIEDRLAAFKRFWPFTGKGTPNWDALATVPLEAGTQGVMMIEAKAHRGEFARPSDAAGATGASLDKIRGSLEQARAFYGVDPSAPAWESSHYQLCNRLAHLYWMNEVAKVPTWLAWVFICDDQVWPDRLSAPDWSREFSVALASVGLANDHRLVDRVALVYLPAAPSAAAV